jgi:hypothetical protein
VTDDPEPRYVVVLDALPADSPPIIRLRHFLRVALRAYRLKAVEVLEGEAAASGDEVAKLRRDVQQLRDRLAERAAFPPAENKDGREAEAAYEDPA